LAPRLMMARTLLSTGRAAMARELAVAAMRTSPQSLQPRVIAAQAWYACLGENASTDELQKLLKFTQETHRAVGGIEPETLPLLVSLQARLGDTAGAAQTLRQALDASPPAGQLSAATAPASSQPVVRVSIETLIRLLSLN